VAFAAPTQLGTTFNNNTATQTTMASSSVVFPTNGQAVLGLFLIAVSGTATAETITCSDNVGNTWTVVATANNTGTGGAHTAIAYFLYPSSGANTTATVTVSWGTAVNMRFGWYGYTTGHATTSPQDASGTGIGGAAVTTLTTTTSGARAASPAGDNELILFAYNTGQATAPTTPTGFTALASPGDATRARSAIFAYQIASGGGGTTASSGAVTNTASSLTPPTGSIATFKAAAAAAAVIPDVAIALTVT
jgi:hypothetical protein